jgi:cytidylate kinase
VPASDAVVLDTTHLDVTQAVAAAIELIEGARARPR